VLPVCSQMLAGSGGICNSVVTWMVLDLGSGSVLLNTLPNTVLMDGSPHKPGPTTTSCTHSTTPVSRFKQGITYMDPWRVHPGTQVISSCVHAVTLTKAFTHWQQMQMTTQVL
jgi:hypothetical protein